MSSGAIMGGSGARNARERATAGVQHTGGLLALDEDTARPARNQTGAVNGTHVRIALASGGLTPISVWVACPVTDPPWSVISVDRLAGFIGDGPTRWEVPRNCQYLAQQSIFTG